MAVKFILLLQGNTTLRDSPGYALGGTRLTAIELEYVGNEHFIPLSHEGTIRAYSKKSDESGKIG